MQRSDMIFLKQKKPVQLKICGITRPQDLVICHDLGVDFIGFNLYRKSKRFVEPMHASGLWQSFRKQYPASKLVPVLVCVDPDLDQLKTWVSLFSDEVILQLHGRETTAFILECQSELKRKIWKAIPSNPELVRAEVEMFKSVVQRILLDSPAIPLGSDVAGGSGTTFSWNDCADLICQDVIGVAGGVNTENINQLIELCPHLIDVASGSESSPGMKDSSKILHLVSACRKAIK